MPMFKRDERNPHSVNQLFKRGFSELVQLLSQKENPSPVGAEEGIVHPNSYIGLNNAEDRSQQIYDPRHSSR